MKIMPDLDLHAAKPSNNKTSIKSRFHLPGLHLTITHSMHHWIWGIPKLWPTLTIGGRSNVLLRLSSCSHCAIKFFGQAEGTLFTTEPLQSHFNWSASTHEAKLVLEGNYSNRDIDHVSQTLLDSFTRVTDLDQFQAKITKEDMSGKFRKWRESMSTSPSGRHLGHYKLLFTTIDKTLPESDRARYRDIQSSIATLYAWILTYAVNHGYSLLRWCNIVNKIVHWGQFSGHPGLDPTTITFLEELCMDYSQMTQTPFVNFDHDAKSCFDRILMSLASLAAWGYGIHREVFFVHAQTLEQAIFKLKLSNKVTGE